VKGVFSRCLLTCPSVDLWRSYLNFIKRVRPDPGHAPLVASCSGVASEHNRASRCESGCSRLPPCLTASSLLPPSRCLPSRSQLNDPRGAQGLPEIRQAYEFTLDRLGQDTACGGIWLDYIAFLQVPAAVRPAYHVPMRGGWQLGCQLGGRRRTMLEPWGRASLPVVLLSVCPA
jgi:cleavage stimulation factor subunit 3